MTQKSTHDGSFSASTEPVRPAGQSAGQGDLSTSQSRAGSAASGSGSPAPAVGASQAAQHLTSEVKGLASDVAHQARHVASDAVDQVRHMAESQLSSSKERVADEIGTVAQALRSTADQLRNQNRSGVTEYVSGAADRIESASRYLNSRDLGQVVSDVERFARREPLIFLGGTFAIGLMLGRFLKASSPPPPAGVRGYLPARGGTSTAYGDQGYGRGDDDRFQQDPYGYQSPSQGYGRRDMSERESSYQGSSYQPSNYQGSSYQGSTQGSSGMQRTPGTPYGASTSSNERSQSSTSGSSTSGVSPAARSTDLPGGVEGVAPRVTQGSPPGAGGNTGTTGSGVTQGSGPGAKPPVTSTANAPSTTTSAPQTSTPGGSTTTSSPVSSPTTKPGTGAMSGAGSSGGAGNA